MIHREAVLTVNFLLYEKYCKLSSDGLNGIRKENRIR